jgi:hypothetical protein
MAGKKPGEYGIRFEKGIGMMNERKEGEDSKRYEIDVSFL